LPAGPEVEAAAFVERRGAITLPRLAVVRSPEVVSTPTGEPLMTSKFRVPAVRPRTVVRRSLVERISAGVRGPLTLVSAPAGAGKTALGSAWISAAVAPGPVTWLTVDEDDHQPGVFWSYVLVGLARAGVPVDGVGVPDRPGTVDRSLLMRLAACLAAQPEPVVVVLDEAETLTDRTVWDELDFVIRRAAPQLRIVVLTRTDPPLPLHRYRLAGMVTELRLPDFAVGLTEAKALLAQHGIRLPESDVARLVEQTRGWAAGIRLIALSLQDSGDAAEAATGDHGDLADYLRTEVLDPQPAQLREFLLRTSIVDAVWPALAEQLSGDPHAARTLATLARRNTFLEAAPAGPGCYEYHPLFRELLRAQLAEESPDDVIPLHRRAAGWLASHGRVCDAVRHAAAAGDWEASAGCIVDALAIGRLLVGPDAGRYRTVLAGMPEDTPGAEVAVVQAALALARHEPQVCTKHLVQARELVDDRLPEQADRLQLASAVVELALAVDQLDVDAALPAANTAEALLTGSEAARVDLAPELHALVLSSRGGALLWAADLAAAAEALAIGIRTAEVPGAEYVRLRCIGQLALVEAVRGRLRRAGELGRRSNGLAVRHRLPDEYRSAAADTALAWVRAEECDVEAARRHADRAAQTLATWPDPVTAAALSLVRCRLVRGAARSDIASQAISAARAAPADTPIPQWLDRGLCRAQAGIRPDAPMPRSPVPAIPQPRQAARTSSPGDPAVPLDAAVDRLLRQAARELSRGDRDRASATLDRALRLAEPERLRRPIAETPPRLRQFLRHNHELLARHPWLGSTVTGTPDQRDDAGEVDGGTAIVEPLTEKEREVLRNLADLLTTEEIARTMYVSVNTVKTHVRGILRKLAVSRRNGAIRRARELGLL
jgi:LuxR family transcriptional regulator, maltose regulon positive regulatory protein